MSLEQIPDYGWTESTATNATATMAPIVDQMLSSFSENQSIRVIDLGCGNGRLMSLLDAPNRAWTGIDASSSGCELAREIAPHATVQHVALSETMLDDLNEPPFDVAVSIEVVEHIYDIWEWAHAARSVIRPGGMLIASTPYHGWLKNSLISLLGRWDDHHKPLWTGGHVKFLSRSTFSELLTEVGFEDLSFRFVGRFPGVWKNMLVTARNPL